MQQKIDTILDGMKFSSSDLMLSPDYFAYMEKLLEIISIEVGYVYISMMGVMMLSIESSNLEIMEERMP